MADTGLTLSKFKTLLEGSQPKTLKITVQDAETRADLMLAIKYLKEAKARFVINTTNSFVDDLIKKYSPEVEVEVWVDE